MTLYGFDFKKYAIIFNWGVVADTKVEWGDKTKGQTGEQQMNKKTEGQMIIF